MPADQAAAAPSKPPPARQATLRKTPKRDGPGESVKPHGKNTSQTPDPARRPSVKKAAAEKSPPRAPGIQRRRTIRTAYMDMLLELGKVPRTHNILSSFFGSLLLAGFVLLPGTFTSLQKKAGADDYDILDPFLQNHPLLVVAATTCGLGAFGLLWLAFHWRRNYVWLLNRIFLPSTTNALAGGISTIVAVYTHKDGYWSLTAKITGIAEATICVVSGFMFVLSTILLQCLIRQHEKEVGRFGKAGGGEEGLLNKARRKWKKPATATQSVI